MYECKKSPHNDGEQYCSYGKKENELDQSAYIKKIPMSVEQTYINR